MDNDRREIEFNVRGSAPIKFSEGLKTGDMTEYGMSVDTVWYSDEKRFGGCMDRGQIKELRDFLTECIEYWEEG